MSEILSFGIHEVALIHGGFMSFFKRIGFFLLTNILVISTISIIWSLVSSFLGAQGLNSYLPTLAIYSAIWGMLGAFISLFMSKWMAKLFHGVKIIDPNTTNDLRLRNLVQKVHLYARKAELTKMPEVGIYESPDINAFATGPSKRNSLVAVSTGLLQRMNDDEIEGVLAHEVSHIANGDMVTMTLIQGIVNAFVLFFSRLLAGIISSNVDEKYRTVVRFVITIVADIAFTILGSLVVNYFSRQREFRADAGGATLSTRGKMIAGLEKLRAVYDMPLDTSTESDTLATLRISHRDTKSWARFFMTHPPLEERIAALKDGRYLQS